MALDIQPLSPARRVIMLVVLLGLLLVSVGFAELLVKSRQAPIAVLPEYRVIFRPPKGLTEPVAAYDALDGAKLSGSGMINGEKRRFVAFSYDSDAPPDLDGMKSEASDLRAEVLGDAADKVDPVRAALTVFAGRQAVQLEDEFKGAAFMILRLTVLPGHVVAICYSGSGNITDADRGYFDDFCATGVVITQMVVRQEK